MQSAMPSDGGRGKRALTPSVLLIDQGLDERGHEELPELPQGARVWFTAFGDRQAATVVTVHHDGTPPYYTISINGQERQTVRTRLEPMDAPAAGAERQVHCRDAILQVWSDRGGVDRGGGVG